MDLGQGPGAPGELRGPGLDDATPRADQSPHVGSERLVARRRASKLASLIDSPELIPGLLAVGVLVAWSVAQGGAATTASNPGALLIAGLLVVTGIAYRRLLRDLPLPLLVALAALGAFVAWSFISIAWAGAKGDAWDGANRALLYFTVFALFAVPPWRARSAAIVLGVYSLAIATVGGVTVLSATGSAHPELYFVAGSFAEPTGYHNADAALFVLGFFPALFLASRRETPWPLRGVLMAAAGLLLELALLPQSRGAVVVFPIAAVLYLALVPGRVRTLVVALPVAAAVALAASPVLDVYPALGNGDVGSALDRALHAMEVSCGALLVVGLALGLADQRLPVPERATRLVSRGVGAAAAIAAVVGVVVVIAVIGNPATWAKDRWQSFKQGYPEQGFSSSRLGGSLGSNRYDFWRVTTDEFSDMPLSGVGSANFAVGYLRDRRSGEEPTDPHSLPLATLAQTGIVGGLLFAAFGVSALLAAARVRWRTGTELGSALAAACVVVFGYWFLHSSGDWFWLLPALSAPGFAFLAIAARIDAPRTPASGPVDVSFGGIKVSRGSSWVTRAGIGVGTIVAVFAALSYGLTWAAARDVELAASSWGANPHAAFDRLDQARKLNVLSAQPDLVAGAIAERLGERRRMRDSFTKALDRDSDNWYALLELGALDATEGKRAAALARLRQAHRLNPLEPVVGAALRGVEHGRAIPLRSIDRRLLNRICQRLGRTQDTKYCR
jgi:O-Antigen ligase